MSMEMPGVMWARGVISPSSPGWGVMGLRGIASFMTQCICTVDRVLTAYAYGLHTAQQVPQRKGDVINVPQCKPQDAIENVG